MGQIIEQADVGRATFYAHFETKDDLLKALCEELFCHLFDAMEGPDHRHIFSCDPPESVFLHLFRHLQKNDNGILQLLSGQNNRLFFQYFKSGLTQLVQSQLPLFAARKSDKLPDSFWLDHITATFIETLHMKQSPETITEYFLLAV